MWTRRGWKLLLCGLLAIGAMTPVVTGQGSPKGKGERKEKEKAKASEPEKAGPSIRVTVTGILDSVVPSNESTGTEMTVEQARGILFELDLSGSKELQEAARRLNGKLAVAKGSLEVREGKSRKLRFILHATELKPAPKP